MTRFIKISKENARNLALHSQGLYHGFGSSLETIKQLTYIQIDTISVTERAHNHVFFSRNPTFKKEEINELMKDKSIFEYWSHAAAYLPMEDFRYSLYKKEQYRANKKHWFPRDKKVERYVMDRIKSEGPLQSKDFDNPKNGKHEWYEWKPAKIALTNLFMDGSLMIKERKGFQKIFDLTERTIPSDTNVAIPGEEEYCHHLVMNAIKAHGLVSVTEMSYLRKGIKPAINRVLKDLMEEGEIVPVWVESSEIGYFALPEAISSIKTIKCLKEVHILSPFDNMVIQRKRIKEFFDFDYQIECYVPEKKRKYGYYTMPVLFGNEFVARMDAKADRKTKVFTVKGIWLEPGFHPSKDFYIKLSRKLQSYSIFCGCDTIKIEKSHPSQLKKELMALI